MAATDFLEKASSVVRSIHDLEFESALTNHHIRVEVSAVAGAGTSELKLQWEKHHSDILKYLKFYLRRSKNAAM